MEKTQNKNKQNVSEIVNKFTNLLKNIQSSEKDVPELEKINIATASEVAIEGDKHCYLVQVETPSEKDLKKVNGLLVKKFEEHFSNPVVVIPAKKRINGKIFKRCEGTKVPRDRTLTAVFDAYLEDLVYPATIVGKRIRFPKGKVRHFKVILDKLDEETVSYKIPSITACYKALTNRELEVAF
jgi:small subunit ribosomal protein S7e